MEGEIEIIRRIAARVGIRAPVTVGIGDDAAVLDDGTVLALDMVVDGVHVRRTTHSPAAIGHTALAVNLSDIAAMGATPVAALVGLGVPATLTADEVDEMYAAMEALAAAHGMSVVGGDVTASPVLTLSVTVMGRTSPGLAPVLRSGGSAGDVLVVSGPLGASATGLLILSDPALLPHLAERDALITAHLRPTPMVAHGHSLAAAGATAMIDISDGLLLDADRLARASGVGAEINLDMVPIAAGLEQIARATGVDTDILAATGGGDYHLLAALPASAPRNPSLAVVGRLVTGPPGVRALRGGLDVTPDRLGWEHLLG